MVIEHIHTQAAIDVPHHRAARMEEERIRITAAGEIFNIGDGQRVGGNILQVGRLNIEGCRRVHARQQVIA